jgi:hypothetical protein
MEIVRGFEDPLGWVFLGSIVVFLAAEAYALFTKTVGDTFSERVWAWLAGRVKPVPPLAVQAMVGGKPEHIRVMRGVVRTEGSDSEGGWTVRRGIRLNTFRWFFFAWFLVGLFVWLTGHFLFGLWAG